MKNLMLTFMILLSAQLAHAWGAIAYDTSTGNWGWAKDFSTQAQAETTALRGCATSNCKVYLVGQNVYMALAVSKNLNSQFGYQRSTNEYQALYGAMYHCSTGYYACKIKGSFYTR